MRNLLLLAFMVVLPLQASAQPGIDLLWDDCLLGRAYSNKSQACDSDAGIPNVLIASLTVNAPITNVIGASGIIEVVVDAGVLPDYWRLDLGQCRAGVLRIDPLVGSGNPPFSCPEPWSQVGNPASSVIYEAPACAPNRAAIVWSIDVQGSVTIDNVIAPIWYLARFDVSHGGTTTCSGCATPACLFLSEVRLIRPAGAPEGDLLITQPGVSKWATWQGGGGIPCPGGHGWGGPTPCAVPVHPVTWGQVKGMYR